MTYGKQAFTLFGSPYVFERIIICQTARAKTSFITGRRSACKGYELILHFFHFFSILAGSLIFSLFFKVIQKQISV